jgi:hypothetical protein
MVQAFLFDIAAMLQQSTSLESLTLESLNRIESCFPGEHQRIPCLLSKHLVLVTVLRHDKTLKTLNMYHNRSFTLTHDEDKQMAALLRKNYAMESLPDIDLEIEAGDLGAILRLNKAGRRYLVDDGSSISKGVKVLSAVSNEINCVSLHLLENPRLATEMSWRRPVIEPRKEGDLRMRQTKMVSESNVSHSKKAKNLKGDGHDDKVNEYYLACSKMSGSIVCAAA